MQVHKDKVNDILRKISAKSHALDAQLRNIEQQKFLEQQEPEELPKHKKQKSQDFKIEQIERRNRIYQYKLFMLHKERYEQ